GNFTHTPPHLLVNNRRWRFFQNFLMPPLDGALALAEMDNVSMFIGQDLHLNVPRVCDQFLDVNLAIAECSQRLAFRRFERRFYLFTRAHKAHALTASAFGRLKHQWITDFFRDALRLAERLQPSRFAWHTPYSSL